MSASKEENRRQAVESLVRDCKRTAEKMGNVNVTEHQIRREIGEMAEKTDRKEDAKGTRTGR